MRINKKLSNYGYCSRKEANRIILEERIMVNGIVARPGQWVEDSDLILFDGEVIKQKRLLYYMYHKPRNVLCSMNEEHKESLIYQLNFADYLFPVGRLDKDSEGLLLLTNDGNLTQEILSPLNYHEKEYVVTVNQTITPSFIHEMEKGVDIKIGLTLPCQIRQRSETQFEIILTQGLNRQIRRMCRALGYEVTGLIRTRILNLQLGELSSNTYRSLSPSELHELRDLLKISI